VQAGDDEDGDDDDTQMAIQSPTDAAAAAAAVADNDENEGQHAENEKHLDNDVATQSPDSYSGHNDDGKPHLWILCTVLLVNKYQ